MLLSLNFFLAYDGLFLSNGPGDPVKCGAVIEIIRKWINNGKTVKPVFGICLGHQILSLAAGFTTSKMKLVTLLFTNQNSRFLFHL